MTTPHLTVFQMLWLRLPAEAATRNSRPRSAPQPVAVEARTARAPVLGPVGGVVRALNGRVLTGSG